MTVILTLCSVVYFSLFATPPLLLTFFLSLLHMLNLFFCSVSLFLPAAECRQRVLSYGYAHSSACATSYPTLFILVLLFLTFFLPPVFPSSKPLLSSTHSGIQWMDYCCISCSLFFLTIVYHPNNHSSALHSSDIVLAFPLTFTSSLNFFLPFLFLPFSPLWAPASLGRGSYPPKPFCETAVPSSCLSSLAL